MKKGGLTLVVTAHRERYLYDAILSVARQVSLDFDLICCADVRHGEAAYKCFQEHLDSVNCRQKRVIPVDGNGTAGRVRNAGFAAAETEWIAYLDADDYLRTDAIEKLKIRVKTADPTMTVYCSGMIRVKADGKCEPIAASLNYIPPLWIYKVDPDTIGHATFFNQFQAIRKQAWQEYPYDETTNGEDIDFMLHQLLLGRYSKIPEYLYYYRDTPDSFSKQVFSEGDICTRRYQSGYYRELFDRSFRSEIAANFRNLPMPTQRPTVRIEPSSDTRPS
jgi:glycosyltransferase involved in cell wall biosynthesis